MRAQWARFSALVRLHKKRMEIAHNFQFSIPLAWRETPGSIEPTPMPLTLQPAAQQMGQSTEKEWLKHDALWLSFNGGWSLRHHCYLMQVRVVPRLLYFAHESWQRIREP